MKIHGHLFDSLGGLLAGGITFCVFCLSLILLLRLLPLRLLLFSGEANECQCLKEC